MGAWVVGVAAAVVGLIGLFLAAKTHDPAMYATGLIVFLAAVLFDFWLIRKNVGTDHYTDH